MINILHSKIRILFLIDGLRIGGKERRVVELLKVLREINKYEIIVFSTKHEIHYDDFISLKLPIYYGIKEETSLLSTTNKLRKRISLFNPHIVHSWSAYTTSLLILVKLMSLTKPFKLINSQITNVPPLIKPLSKFWVQTRINFFFSDVIISNTRMGIERYKSPIRKSSCIYNSYDFKRIEDLESPEIVKNKYGIKKEKIIGMIGNINRKKDYHCFINAAISVMEKRNDVIFFVIGNGKMLNEVKKLVPDEFSQKVIFTGHIQKVENLIQIFNIGVLCTNSKVHGEGISNVILELMAQAKPVIATFGGGTSEIISDGVNGMLIKPRDYRQLSLSIDNLLSNSEHQQYLGGNAKKTVIKKFNNRVNNNRYFYLYKSLIK